MNASPVSLSSPYFWIGVVFTIWMVLDASRRRVDWFWYLVALLTPFIYFLMVKLPNNPAIPEAGSNSDVPQVGKSKRQLGSSPFLSNLDRADQLEEIERYDEAVPIYQEALDHDPNNLRSLHGMARCELGLGHPRIAVSLLEQVLNTDREYGNYAAALDYADALWMSGQKQDTLELLDGLVHATGRPNHCLAHAHYLAENGELAKAKAVVDRVIEEHASLHPAEQPKDQYWRDRAEQMLANLAKLES